MALRDDLLNPIPGASPGGVDLRYDPVYEKIKDARREDDDAPQGEWARARKLADWPLVIKLTSDALATRTKDVQLAAWLTEAALKKDGISGLRDGLVVLHGFVDQFWDHLYPELDDGDAEMRAAPLDWVGVKLDVPVRMAPLSRGGHGLLAFRDARLIGYEADADTSDKQAARASAVAAGKTTGEEWDKAFESTPKAWYKTLTADIDAALATLQALDDLGREKFGDVAPGYGRLRDALGEVEHTVKLLLRLKLEKEPDPVEAVAEPVAADTGAAGGARQSSASASSSGTGAVTAEPTSVDDAGARIAGAARFIRRADPTNPSSYLLLRGFRWGELRRGGRDVDPRLLEAPPTQARTKLKGLLLDRNWTELLEAAELVMGSPYGRGWLDLQRYTLAATEGLGGDYQYVSAAIVSELRSLLADLPGLLEMTLMDDTPTANAETARWLKDAGLTSGRATDARPARASVAVAAIADAEIRGDGAGALGGGPVYARAMGEVRAGRAQRGIELLSREVAREKSRRGRFLRQTQMAALMVEAGNEKVAKPILEDLVGQVEAFRLEEWEGPDVIAPALALLYQCLDRLGEDESTKQSLYLRVCRLDPMAALRFMPGAAAESDATPT